MQFTFPKISPQQIFGAQTKMADYDEQESDRPDEAMLPPSSGPIRHSPAHPHNPPYTKRPMRPPNRQPRQTPPPLSNVLYGSSPGFTPSPSPFDGLSSVQIKKLQRQYQKTDEHVHLIADICHRIYGEVPDHECLVSSIGEALNAAPDIRIFSGLTNKDYDVLNRGVKASIDVDERALLEKVPLNAIPDWFWPSQKSYRACLSRKMEMGVRNLIGNVLVAAVEIARSLFGNQRLVVHSEWEIPATEVP